MQIEVLQENLVKGLGYVSKFVSSKPTLPVLAAVKLEASGGKLTMVATNMDNGVEVELKCKVIKSGLAVVPAKVMYEYVNLLPKGKVLVESKSGVMKMEAGGNKAKVKGMESEDFPEIPDFSIGEKFGVAIADLKKVVNLVAFCAASDSVRPVLSGLLFEFGKKTYKVVATDGYRLSLLSGLTVEGKPGTGKMLVPAGVVTDVERLVEDEASEKVELIYSKERKSLVFSFGAVKVMTRLLEGDFPGYERIMPKQSKVEIEVDREQLADAVKVSSVFARESSNIVKCKLTSEEVLVSANSVSVGENVSEVGMKVVKGEATEMEIAFNGRFLLDLLNHVPGDKLVMGVQEPLQPGLFKTDDDDFAHVIMPVRVQGGEERV